MEKGLKLKVEDILNKQFNIGFKGYSSVEVDRLLDLVADNYWEYDTMIGNLGECLQECERQTVAVKTKVTKLERGQGAVREENAAANGNVDILKRLTRSENTVFTSEKQTVSSATVASRKVRGKSMLARSVMDIVFVLDETINPGSASWRLERACGESYGGLF